MGHVWTYNTAEAFNELMPYFSPNKIQKLLKQLEVDGVIVTGNFNRKRYDKTKWYTMPGYEVSESLQPNGGMDNAKRLKGISETAEHIPDVNADITTDIKNNVSNATECEKLWNELRDIYKKYDFKPGNKQPALKEIKKIKADSGLLSTIKLRTDQHLKRKRELLTKGEFTANPKHVVGWIKDRCWEDELDSLTVNKTNSPPVPQPPHQQLRKIRKL
jgi:hypothetical protein